MSATPSSIKAMLPWFALALIVFAIDFVTKSIVLSFFLLWRAPGDHELFQSRVGL